MSFFKKLLEILNQNDRGVRFNGERFFQFNQEGQFALYEPSSSRAMEYDTIEFTPMSELPQTETPFTDLNERSDFLKQFIFAIRVEQPDFEESNPSYLALLDFSTDYQRSTITDGGFSYTLKTFEPVRESTPQTMGNHAGWWVLVSLSINVTRLKEGSVGTSATIEVSTDEGATYHVLDATNITLPMSVDFEGARRVNTAGNNIHFINGKTSEITLDVNHRETTIDNDIEDAMLSGDYNRTFMVRFTRPGHSFTRKVSIKQGTPEYENGVPLTYSITFIERA